MLKTRDFPKGEVVAFRLSTGDEIIGEVVDTNDDGVAIKKPCTLGMGQDGNVGLTPASIMSDPEKPVFFKRIGIVATMEPREDAVRSYQTHATGIQLQNTGVSTQSEQT